jgi:hypothetical protein
MMASDTEMAVAFSPAEAEQLGLVDEQAVDWNAGIDLDLSSQVGESDSGSSEPDALDLNLDSPPPPTQGVQLIHHMQPGSAYLMHIDDKGWRKVRLSWMSPGRGFFVFGYGREQQKTVSMTARMLYRMLENKRFRTYERAELIERATVRARRQLTQLNDERQPR